MAGMTEADDIFGVPTILVKAGEKLFCPSCHALIFQARHALIAGKLLTEADLIFYQDHSFGEFIQCQMCGEPVSFSAKYIELMLNSGSKNG